MSTNADVLKAAKFANVDALIDAANAVGLPLWIATAFVQMESYGQNIYGHDLGGTFAGAGAITNQNYAQFYDAVINKHARSNGVGPMQITWPGFLTDAKAKGINLADPRDNFVYGFRLIAGYLGGNYSAASIAAAGRRYNGSAAYGTRVAAIASQWHGKLVNAVSPKPANASVPPVLRKGAKGNAVRSLQNGLNRVFPAYSHLVADGVFGAQTERVVVEFQTRSRLLPDGVVGPKTRSALYENGVRF